MRLTATAIIALTCVAAFAAPTVTAVQLAEAPTIDGKLTDACWQQPAQIRNFLVLGQDEQATNQTEAWVACDSQNLYIALKAFDAEMPKLKATAKDRDGRVFSDDCLEIFLDTALDHFHLIQFALNPVGTRFDRAGDAAGSLPDWDIDWTVRTARGTDHWSAEVAIPFAGLPFGADQGNTWGLNIARERAADGELSTWAPLSDVFAKPAQFGTVEVEADLTPYLVELIVDEWGRGIQGQNTLTLTIANHSAVERDLSVRLTIAPPDEKPRDIVVPVGSVPGNGTAEAEVTYQVFQEGSHALMLAVAEAANLREDEPAASVGRRISIASTAEFSVYKSFYRDQVTVGYDLRVPDDTLRQYTVTAQLKAAGEDEVLDEAWAKSITAPKGLLRLNTGTLPMGQYEIHATLTDPAKRVVAEDILRFPQLRDNTVQDRLVTVRDDNMLIVEGKPFFPLGIYERPGSELALQRLADAGFNVCAATAGPKTAKIVLDKAREQGLHVWLPISSTLDLSSDREKRLKALHEYAEGLRDHPGLLCWESIDEPAWGSRSAEGLYEGYCVMRELDQQHPVWMNHAPRNLISTLAYYNRGADIAGCDIYPVPEPQSQSNLPNKTISVVADETEKNRTAVCGEKPIFMVLQGFGWKELSRTPEGIANAVLPTFEQSRFMAYDAIVHGANGLLYWGTHYTQKPSRFYSELKTLISELACIHDVLASRTYVGRRGAPPVPQPEGIAVLRKLTDNGAFIIAVNETPEARTVKLDSRGWRGNEARRLFEGERLPVAEDGTVEVTLEGYGVAVLTDNMAFKDVRKDFSEEWKNAPDAAQFEPLMHQPGNAVTNPGMEADRDGDSIPDGWGARQPFSVTLTEEDARSGKYAVAITGQADDAMPLIIQNGIPLNKDTAYHMSTWAKTADPDVEFRMYIEWSIDGKWYSGMGAWTRGTDEWQQLTVDFEPIPDPQGKAYLVLQVRGNGRVVFDDVAIRERE